MDEGRESRNRLFSFLSKILAIWDESINMLDSINSNVISVPLTVIVVGCEFSLSNINFIFIASDI